MSAAHLRAESPRPESGQHEGPEAGPYELVLELSRADNPEDAYDFHAGSRDYLVRVGDGGVKRATLPWGELLGDLAALTGGRPDGEMARRLGERMRRFLDALDWGGHEEALERARGKGGQLRLVVRSSAAELYSLPWELVTLEGSGRHLADVPGCTLRYEWPQQREPGARGGGTREGRVLLAWSEAGGAVPEDKHLLALMKASQQGDFAFDSRRDVLPRVSLESLDKRLAEARDAQEPVSVLHVLCHGAPLETSGPGLHGLAWNASEVRGGTKELVDGVALGAVLAPYADTLRMVVLCACHGGDGGRLAGYLGSVAQELHRAGIDMVVASRLPLSTVGSVLLAETLYQKLLVDSCSLEEALEAVRRRLRVEARSFDWASLQLYARREGEADLRPVVLRPYRGLLAFEAKHRRFFFGREKLSRELFERVRDAAAGRKPRFQVVAGASGAGKSSVVMAGLVPLLSPEEWDVVVVRPGELAAEGAASEEGFPSLRELSRRLRAAHSPEPLSAGQGATETEVLVEARLLRQARPGRGLLLVVDQLEEVFTQLASLEERSSLMRVLWTLARSTELGCVVLGTLRVDHFERSGEVALDERTRLDTVVYAEEHRVFVAHMEEQEVAATIERPARAVGLELEAGLVEQLCQDVGKEPGALPLLEYALDLLWERREGRRLTNRVYEELGGVTGALTRTAERLYESLSEPQRRQARRLLVRLVDFRDAASPQTRRRVREEEVRPVEQEVREAFDEVLEKLVRSRLLVKGEEQSEGEGGTWVQFAHEALIRRWKAVQTWVKEDWEREQQLRELDAWAKAWEARQGGGDRGTSYLLTGDRLGYARRVRDNHRGELSARSLRFIAASDVAEARRRKQLGAVVLSLAVLLLLAVVAAIVAAWQREQAIEQRRESEHQRTLALDASRVFQARRLLERDPTAAALVLREVLHPEETPEWTQTALDLLRNPVSAAVLTRHQELVTSTAFLEQANGRIEPGIRRSSEKRAWSMDFSPDGQWVVSVTRDRTPRVWRADGSGEPVVLRGHEDRVSSAAFSPDGQWVVTTSIDKTARVWRADGSGEPVVLRGHENAVESAVFSPDGQWVVTASMDGTARVWRTDGRGTPVVLRGHENAVESAVFSPDGQWVVTASLDLTARVWRADGRGTPVVLPHHHGRVRSAAFSPDGQWVVTASGYEAWVWRADGMGPPVVLHGHRDIVWSAAFSADGQWVVTASDDKTARVWRADGTGRPVVLRGHADAVRSAAFSPDGQWVVTASDDMTARLWRADGRGEPVVFLGHDKAVWSAGFSPNGQWVGTVSQDGTARLWRATGTGEPRVLRGHDQSLWSAAFSADGQWVVTASDDMTARVWRTDGTGTPVELRGHEGELRSAALSPDGQRVVTASMDGTARVWRADGSGAPVVLRGHGAAVWSAAFSPDGQRVVTASLDGSARVWRADGTGTPVVLCGRESTGGLVRSAAFSPDGQRVVTASVDGAARVWRVDRTGTPVVLRGHEREVVSAAFSPDGQWVVTASMDGTARVWRADGTGTPVVLRGHEEAVRSAAFSPDGQWVVTGSNDGTARVWRADGKGTPVVLRGNGKEVPSAAFSPDGRRVVTASMDTTARLWTLDVSRLQALLRTETTTCLDREQRQRFLMETPEQAQSGHEQCERAHGRKPESASSPAG
ncbi:CHAT domain-containing protein [Archangium violaceum]|uniref:nSTAND1 domain-containing NTPase n=1 Tax=Archangium violaceum TaxID=83451 RepID=UPI0019516EAC|nr:CHAT domain-containing protein [Archangium violaceum]QRN96796.1 CHAT domain-containing protein [Archangium violaceum]